MKKSSGLIGILAVLFFNIFLFTSSAVAETTKETKIVVGEGGIHQQTITTETTKKVNWNVNFPENFHSYCMERMISDYKEGKIKPGYSRNCDFTTNIFSLDPLGFFDVPMMEKNWGVIVDDEGVKFRLLPIPEITKDNFLNVTGIALFGASWFFLAGMNGYIGRSRKYLFGVFGLSPVALYLLNIFSIRYPFLIVILLIILMIVSFLAVYFKGFFDIKPWQFILLGILVAVGVFCIDFSVLAVNIISHKSANNYALFQLIVFAYAMSIRETVYAWRKEKLVTPKMVEARRQFLGQINNDNGFHPIKCCEFDPED